MRQSRPADATPNFSDYFSRMTTVPDIGIRGLKLLQSTRVTMVGVGGVGSATALHLARSGVGHLKLIDQDVVEPSNLQRMHGVDQSSLYHPKAETIAEYLHTRFPWLDVDPIVETIRSTNVDHLLKDSQVVVDGVDNFKTRYQMNSYSVRRAVPYIFTSAIQNQGHVGLFSPPRTACLECQFKNAIDRPEESCENLGVTPIITSLVGVLAANETVKIALSIPSEQMGKVMTFDALGPWFFQSEVSKREGCPTCGKVRKEGQTFEEDTATTLCGENTFNVVPDSSVNIDLRRSSKSIASSQILTATRTVVVYRKGYVTISVFRTGRILVSGVENSQEAVRVAEEARSLFSAAAEQVA